MALFGLLVVTLVNLNGASVSAEADLLGEQCEATALVNSALKSESWIDLCRLSENEYVRCMKTPSAVQTMEHTHWMCEGRGVQLIPATAKTASWKAKKYRMPRQSECKQQLNQASSSLQREMRQAESQSVFEVFSDNEHSSSECSETLPGLSVHVSEVTLHPYFDSLNMLSVFGYVARLVREEDRRDGRLQPSLDLDDAQLPHYLARREQTRLVSGKSNTADSTASMREHPMWHWWQRMATWDGEHATRTRPERFLPFSELIGRADGTVCAARVIAAPTWFMTPPWPLRGRRSGCFPHDTLRAVARAAPRAFDIPDDVALQPALRVLITTREDRPQRKLVNAGEVADTTLALLSKHCDSVDTERGLSVVDKVGDIEVTWDCQATCQIGQKSLPLCVSVRGMRSLSFDQQMLTMVASNAFISSHGAGLSWTLFQQPESLLYEWTVAPQENFFWFAQTAHVTRVTSRYPCGRSTSCKVNVKEYASKVEQPLRSLLMRAQENNNSSDNNNNNNDSNNNNSNDHNMNDSVTDGPTGGPADDVNDDINDDINDGSNDGTNDLPFVDIDDASDRWLVLGIVLLTLSLACFFLGRLSVRQRGFERLSVHDDVEMTV